MNMAWSVLKAINFPNYFLGKTIVFSVYIVSRTPTNNVKGKVPQEARSGIESSVSPFIIFGFISYAHVPNELRGKLDNKSEKCSLIGYNEQSR